MSTTARLTQAAIAAIPPSSRDAYPRTALASSREQPVEVNIANAEEIALQSLTTPFGDLPEREAVCAVCHAAAPRGAPEEWRLAAGTNDPCCNPVPPQTRVAERVQPRPFDVERLPLHPSSQSKSLPCSAVAPRVFMCHRVTLTGVICDFVPRGGGMKINSEKPRSFLTSRRACDQLGYSRPDSFLRAWRTAGLPVYKRNSGRNLNAENDLDRFVSPERAEPSTI